MTVFPLVLPTGQTMVSLSLGCRWLLTENKTGAGHGQVAEKVNYDLTIFFLTIHEYDTEIRPFF